MKSVTQNIEWSLDALHEREFNLTHTLVGYLEMLIADGEIKEPVVIFLTKQVSETFDEIGECIAELDESEKASKGGRVQ